MSVMDPSDVLATLERQGQAKTEVQDELPPTKTFDIDVKDGRGRRYQGRFFFTVPKLGDQIKIGQVKAFYLPGGTPDPASQALVDILAYLTVTCTFNDEYPKPAWFAKALDLYDATPLQDVYGRALEYERKFLSGGKVGSDNDRAAQGEEGPAGADSPHVGRKVQPPAERRETLAGDST